MNPLLAQLTHRPFPDVAQALRSRVAQITLMWDASVRHAMPQMRHLTFDELKDSTPEILLAIAEALASDDPDLIGDLVSCAPAQGLSRLRLNFDVVEVMQEDRLLRAIIVQQVEAALRRRMDELESAALHAAIDVMLQRSVVALVNEQKYKLRAAAETELKFLSFLSHDMNNNLGGVSLWLQALGQELKTSGGFVEARKTLESAQQSIHDTVVGMRRMLEHERLRKTGAEPDFASVDLHALVSKVVDHFSPAADFKGLKLSIELPRGTFLNSNGELLTLVLQNLVGNAVKYSTAGVIHISCEPPNESGKQTLRVSDEGPGIAPEKLEHIFEAFRRGEVHGQSGVGLGLAIASQAANLLGASLTVDSKIGVGSTFSVRLPSRHGLSKSLKPSMQFQPLQYQISV